MPPDAPNTRISRAAYPSKNGGSFSTCESCLPQVGSSPFFSPLMGLLRKPAEVEHPIRRLFLLPKGIDAYALATTSSPVILREAKQSSRPSRGVGLSGVDCFVVSLLAMTKKDVVAMTEKDAASFVTLGITGRRSSVILFMHGYARRL